MRHFSVILTALCLSGTLPIHAAGHALTLEQCREMALTHNLAIQQAAAQVESADATQKSYKANYFPSISLSGMMVMGTLDKELTIDGGYLPTFAPDASGVLQPQIIGQAADGTPLFASYAFMPDIALRFKMNSLVTGGLQLEQPLYMGGKVGTAYKMAELGGRMARESASLTRDEVILESDKAYYSCVEAQAMVKSLEVYCGMLEELARVVGHAVDAGMKQRKDLLSVQVKQNEAALNLSRAEHAVQLAGMNLCRVTGLPLTEDVEVVLEEAPSVLQLPDAADVKGRKEYTLLTSQMELKAYETELEKSALRPQVGLMALYGYGHGLQFNGDNLLDGGSFVAMLKVSVPILHAGEGRHKVQAAEAESRKAELAREDAARKMELEIRQAVSSYQEAQLEVELTRKSLEQADENCKVSRDRYDAGQEMLTDLLEAQTFWQQAEAGFISACARMGLAGTVCLKAAGKL